MTRDSYEVRLAAWKNARFAPPPEQDLTPSKPSFLEMVSMRDGVRLYTEIFLPALTGRFPVVLIRSPYPYSRPSRNDKLPISRYLEAGFAIVFQMTRGQYKSEGIFRFFKDDVADGFDCVNWVATRDWCDGNVGMEGPSYLGGVQLYAARSKPEALKCIMPTAFVGNFVQNFPFANGVPMRGVFMQWYKVVDAESMAQLDAPYGDMRVLEHDVWGPALRYRPLMAAADTTLSGDKLASWREVMANPFDNDYWTQIHFTDAQLAELDLPVFFTDGWYDMTIGPIDFFTRLERLQPEKQDRYLLVGPWNHCQTYTTQTHEQDNEERKMPRNGAVDLVAQRLAFFDRYLRGNTQRVVQTDRVRLYITGADVWRDYSTFPVPGTEERQLHLHSQGDARSFPGDGSLSWEVPAEEPVDHYVYDPTLPTGYTPEGFVDCRHYEVRSDVLTYTSEPFDSPLTILGEIKLVLYAATDGLDTDWFAVVTEVFPDGRSIPFHGSMGVLRARYHKGLEREQLLTPNEPTLFQMNLGPAGHQIAAANCLRLNIFSAAFPAYDINSNTGNPPAADTDYRIARQTIFHDFSRPSHLILPIITL